MDKTAFHKRVDLSNVLVMGVGWMRSISGFTMSSIAPNPNQLPYSSH